MQGAYWIQFLNIIVIDLVLSGDNAVVIGMACRALPLSERRRAVIYGTLGAVLLRIVLSGLATWMLEIPLVKAVGGVMLLWIAIRLAHDRGEVTDVAYGRTLGQAVKTIVVADFVMSLDNVLAIGGAAHGDLSLVLFGLGLSIPLLVWGSGWIARLMDRFPLVISGGAGVLAYTAVHMCLEDPYVWRLADRVAVHHAAMPLLTACLVFGWTQWTRRGAERT